MCTERMHQAGATFLSVSVLRQVLQDFQENPQAAQRHTKNPMIMEKLQKLINAGIVRQA